MRIKVCRANHLPAGRRTADQFHLLFEVEDAVFVGQLLTWKNVPDGDLKAIARGNGVTVTAVINVLGEVPGHDTVTVLVNVGVLVNLFAHFSAMHQVFRR